MSSEVTSGQRAAEKVLAVSAALTLGGWAALHLFWDAPYRGFFWSESLAKPIVEGVIGVPWEFWVTDGAVDEGIQTFIRVVGLGLLASAFVAARAWRESGRRHLWLLPAGSLGLLACALLTFKEKNYNPAGLVEWGARVLEPLVLFGLVTGWLSRARALILLKVAIVTTFVAHGAFAMGLYPVPGNFIDMVINLFGVSEPQARTMLKFAGAMDILLSIAIFAGPRIAIPALAYASVWGLLTALARPASYLATAWAAPGAFSFGGMAYWGLEALTRAAHFGVPLVALMMVLAARRENSKQNIFSRLPAKGLAGVQQRP